MCVPRLSLLTVLVLIFGLKCLLRHLFILVTPLRMHDLTCRSEKKKINPWWCVTFYHKIRVEIQPVRLEEVVLSHMFILSVSNASQLFLDWLFCLLPFGVNFNLLVAKMFLLNALFKTADNQESNWKFKSWVFSWRTNVLKKLFTEQEAWIYYTENMFLFEDLSTQMQTLILSHVYFLNWIVDETQISVNECISVQ